MSSFFRLLASALLVFCLGPSPILAAEAVKVTPVWDAVTTTSRTSLALHMCPYPHIRRGHPLHDKLWKLHSDFQADYQRILMWYPYPRLVVAELFPPKDGKTFWDFSLMDPIVEDFLRSANGRPVVMDFGTVPNWIYTKTPQPIPDDPEELVWNYYAAKPTTSFLHDLTRFEPKPRLTDEQVKLIADYQARVAGWYTKGGFQDEYGKWHKSGHQYRIDYWEVLSEVEYEWGLSPQDYTRVYDAVVEAVRRVNPEMKFIGLSLASPRNPEFFLHFLDPKNHKPGIPLEMISIHSYASADPDENDPAQYQHNVFRQVDAYAGILSYVIAIRDRLSPKTRIAINEVGLFLPDNFSSELFAPIPENHWNMAAAMSAYHFGLMIDKGIDIVNNGELIDYPGQTAALTLADWETGEPNARYWALKLLRDSFAPGDKVVEAPVSGDSKSQAFQVYSKGFIGVDGKRRILLINKRDRAVSLSVEGAKGASIVTVAGPTKAKPQAVVLSRDEVRLDGFAVAVVTLK